MKVTNVGKIPIRMWLNDLETGALRQAINLSNLPFVFKHVAIMPDAHQGYGMPIGGVLATNGVVIPNAVGVDIGCGMCAMKTDLKEFDTQMFRGVLALIRERIPVGFNKHKESQSVNLMPHTGMYNMPVVDREHPNALKSLGTLGGGNHFIELQQDEEGYLWVMIHSGSRNLGKQVADHYNKIAIALNARWHTMVPKEHDLAFLPLCSDEAESYRLEMHYCISFARANRETMMERVHGCLVDIFGPIVICDQINIAHNYARIEHHFGKDVMIHRKGATSAKDGEIGIIPGSQGTASYIVQGLGNPQSFRSCAHGAGRKMGRNAARRKLSLEDEQTKMTGIIHSVHGKNDLDEAPGAYKDIDEVMANQNDLVEIVTRLRPLAVVKG